MEQFLKNLLTASIHGSVVILAVILLRLILRKTPKKYICLLWLLVGIRLLIPIEIRSDLSLQPSFNLPVFRFSGAGWAAVLPWLWGFVAAGFAVFSLVSYGKLKRRVKNAVRVRGGWESDKIDTAFILGFIKPRIYIPKGMTQTSQKYILEHERTHLDKGDHWIKMIGFLALALHWFNPLVWVAYILLCKDIEMACDERVVQFLELDERKSYSAALLSCSSRQLHLSANPVAFGEVSVKQRILNVLNYKKPSFWFSLLGVIAFFFVTLCLLTSPEEKTEPVLVEVPAGQYVEATSEERNQTAARLQDAWDAILSQDTYHLFFAEESSDGGVGWQVNFYKDGENTLWKSTDHLTEEGHMVLDGVSYKFFDGNDGGWAPYEEEDVLLDTMLEQFSLEGKVLTDVDFQRKTNDYGNTYDELTFNAHFDSESGETVTQPIKAYFGTSGTMTGMRVGNPTRKGADYFTFTNWVPESEFNNVDDIFASAREKIISIDAVHPSKLKDPTQDEQRIQEWGIQFLVDDDLLTQYGGEVWFCQSNGYDMVVHTDNAYWLEKRNDTGWEILEPKQEPKWNSANYTLGHGMYTMVFADWSELYGPLPSGKYRMGKTFEMVSPSGGRCTGYAEFDIYHNDASTEDQTAAVERCYAALDELKSRKSIHWLSTMGEDGTREFWVNGEDYLSITYWPGPDAPEEEWTEHDRSLFPRTDTSVRYNGVGYGTARDNPEVLSSKVIGMQLSTLSPDRGGWSRNTIADDYLMAFFERGNLAITFPEGVGVVSDKMVRFQTNWTIFDGTEEAAQLTYQFDDNGNLCYMEYKTEHEPGNVYVSSIRIYDDTAEEIDAKIKPYTENLVVADFSWEDAQKKYTAEEFNIRKDGFVNTGTSPITGPVEAARLAMKEYPDLQDDFSIEVFRDKTTGMWKVTIKGEVSVQCDYDYRDVYLSDSGATQLLVYEGPVRFDESRK